MTIPVQVLGLLKNSQYLHLATSQNDIPHVSLMNYTFVGTADSPYSADAPAIVLTSNRDTEKVKNIGKNPHVSLLVHDWTTPKSVGGEQSLSRVLNGLNQTELSSRSATLAGTATIVSDAAKAEYFAKLHLSDCAKNAQKFADNDMVVILVKLTSAKVVDLDNHVETFSLNA